MSTTLTLRHHNRCKVSGSCPNLSFASAVIPIHQAYLPQRRHEVNHEVCLALRNGFVWVRSAIFRRRVKLLCFRGALAHVFVENMVMVECGTRRSFERKCSMRAHSQVYG